MEYIFIVRNFLHKHTFINYAIDIITLLMIEKLRTIIKNERNKKIIYLNNKNSKIVHFYDKSKRIKKQKAKI